MINQEKAKQAWSRWLTELHDPTINRCLAPKVTYMTATLEPKSSKPKVKDEFLADLIRHFGAEYGVELYQAGNVSKDDLAAFVALLAKFDVVARRAPAGITRQNVYPETGFVSAGTRMV